MAISYQVRRHDEGHVFVPDPNTGTLIATYSKCLAAANSLLDIADQQVTLGFWVGGGGLSLFCMNPATGAGWTFSVHGIPG